MLPDIRDIFDEEEGGMLRTFCHEYLYMKLPLPLPPMLRVGPRGSSSASVEV